MGTTDYAWYLLLRSITYSPSGGSSTPASLLVWTRRDSKVAWSSEYAALFRAPLVELGGEEGRDEDDEGVTMKEERERRWADEEAQGQVVDKVAMRAYYKVRVSLPQRLSLSPSLLLTWLSHRSLA